MNPLLKMSFQKMQLFNDIFESVIRFILLRSFPSILTIPVHCHDRKYGHVSRTVIKLAI